MRPVIGITCGTAGVPVAEGVLPSYYLGVGYPRAVWEAGGQPFVLAAVPDQEAAVAKEVLHHLDGLLLAGGTDIDPGAYGADPDGALKPDPSRDRFEMTLLDQASAHGVPVLGICRGFQVINVWAGGTLAQHRPHTESVAADLGGMRVESTRVHLDEKSRVGSMFDSSELLVRCLHHQAIDRVGDGLRVVGRSEDGLVEALESTRAGFLLGVLWHPEQMLEAAESIRPYQALVRAARDGRANGNQGTPATAG